MARYGHSMVSRNLVRGGYDLSIICTDNKPDASNAAINYGPKEIHEAG